MPARDFVFSKTPRQVLGTTQASIQYILWFFPGINLPGREVIHPLPWGAEVKNEWSYTSTPLYMPHGTDKEDVTLHDIQPNVFAPYGIPRILQRISHKFSVNYTPPPAFFILFQT
jgi:hypothetical protein